MIRPASNSAPVQALLPRQQSIVQLAKERGFVTIDDLSERLKVTTQTIRRDISLLCEQGMLSRFHGGAAFRSSIANLPYETRRDSLALEKMQIAELVAAEISDNASVFIDIGTTAEAVAVRLLDKRNMRIVTNNLNVVESLGAREDFEIIVTGGSVRFPDRAIMGEASAAFIREFHLDYAVLGVVAISAEGDVLDFFMEEKPVTQAILGCARNTFIVADHSKFGRGAMVKVAHLSQADVLFTDALPNQQWAERLADTGIRVMTGASAPLLK